MSAAKLSFAKDGTEQKQSRSLGGAAGCNTSVQKIEHAVADVCHDARHGRVIGPKPDSDSSNATRETSRSGGGKEAIKGVGKVDESVSGCCGSTDVTLLLFVMPGTENRAVSTRTRWRTPSRPNAETASTRRAVSMVADRMRSHVQ